MIPIYVLLVVSSFGLSTTPMLSGERVCTAIGAAAVQMITDAGGKSASFRCIKEKE